VTDRQMDGRTTRTIAIAGPHIVVGQLKGERFLEHGVVSYNNSNNNNCTCSDKVN